MSPLVSIVTVTFQSFQSLRRLRQSLLEHTPPCRIPYEWLIVDNGSTRPETLAELADIEASREAVVIYHDENLRFTKGCNAGIAKAGGDLILLLNPDIAVSAGWLSALCRVAARPRVGIVGTVLVNERGLTVHAGAAGTGDHIADGQPYDPGALWAQDREHDGWVTGACLLITRPALEAVGGRLNEDYPHYHSDRVLGEAVRMAGFQIWMSGHPLVHSVGGSAL